MKEVCYCLFLRYVFCKGALSVPKGHAYPWQCYWKFYMPQKSMFVWGPPSHGRQMAPQGSCPCPAWQSPSRTLALPPPYKIRREGEEPHACLRKSKRRQSGRGGGAWVWEAWMWPREKAWHNQVWASWSIRSEMRFWRVAEKGEALVQAALCLVKKRPPCISAPSRLCGVVLLAFLIILLWKS